MPADSAVAEVKLETFPFTRYGTVPATVKFLSQDAVVDEKKGSIFQARLALARDCRRPTTEQVLRLFSLAQRHRLTQAGQVVQSFDVELTDLQRQVLSLLGVPETAYRSVD